ncbi:elongation factor P maturation arginine rhamnosyltransferase EarP [Chitinimonas lacunae]|uniref:Protein-arginine rhamnosyltransferase n=1 Tax=Chitinimonas lacunae TaxID=1963018 RepID=A0ABV8MKP3_9NEIS
MKNKSFDIFCTVIDNYGDIGVCWRLSRQLVAEHGATVRLWVDDLASFAVLERRIDPTQSQQTLCGVEVRHWSKDWSDVTPREVVIEAFACDPPEPFLLAMAAMKPAPVWINLEYLTAESWIDDCHGLGSRHPRLPLTRHFFFSGFSATSGGLLREGDLIERRERFQRMERESWLAGLGIEPSALTWPCHSLFCYDNPALPGLLARWTGEAPRLLLVADGKPRRQVEQWLGREFPVGTMAESGALRLFALPFLSQDDYDRLLWSCDLNFVRGEDSFVRAQWAGVPLVWHIYPQDDDAHRQKLAAFLSRYQGFRDEHTADSAESQFWLGWNGGDAAAGWDGYAAALPTLARHAADWCTQQAQSKDLATALVLFIESRV